MCVHSICVLLFDCCHIYLECADHWRLSGSSTVLAFGSGMIHLLCPWSVAHESVATVNWVSECSLPSLKQTYLSWWATVHENNVILHSRYVLWFQSIFTGRNRMPLIVTQKAAACFMVSVSRYNLMAVAGMCLNFDCVPIYSKCSLHLRFRLHLVWLKVPLC